MIRSVRSGLSVSLEFHLDAGMLYILKFILIGIHLHATYYYFNVVKACLYVSRRVFQLWYMELWFLLVHLLLNLHRVAW